MNLAMTIRLWRLQAIMGWRSFVSRLSHDRGGWRSYILLALVALGFLPAVGSLLTAGVSAYLGARAAGQPEAALTIVMVTGQAFALVFGFFYVMSAFFFARDLRVLLPLPLQPGTIVAAKFLQVLVTEYLTMAAVVLPAFIAYGAGSGTPLFWPLALLVLLALPVLPLAVDGLLVLLLMSATAGRRLRLSRDVLRVAGALVGVALVFYIQFGVRGKMQAALPPGGAGRAAARQYRGDPLKDIFTANRDVIQKAGSFVPPVLWATAALAAPLSARGGLGLAGYLGAGLAAMALLLWLVSRLYLRSLFADEGGRPRRAATAGEVRAAIGPGRTPFAALLWREYALLVRNPMFLLNAILPLLIIPLASLGPLLAGGNDGTERLRHALLSQPVLVAFLPAIAVGVELFVALTGSVSTTAISREGRRFWISRILPVDPGLQVAAKIALGVLHSLVGVAIVTGILVFWLRASLLAVAVTIVAAVAASALMQGVLLLIDLTRPYLAWTDPQQAMKGNINVLIGLLVVLLLLIVLAALSVFFYWISPKLIMPGLILTSLAGAWGMYRWDVSLARVRYREIED